MTSIHETNISSCLPKIHAFLGLHSQTHNFSVKNTADNIGKIVYQKYRTSRFRLQHSSATWTQTIVIYRGNSVVLPLKFAHYNYLFVINSTEFNAVLEIRIFLNRPNSMKIPKSCFKLNHFNTNLGKIYRPNQDLNRPSSILTGLGQFLPPNFAHCNGSVPWAD